MDDQYEYWKDKVECIIYNTITHNLTIQFTRPSIPDAIYKDISYNLELLGDEIGKIEERLGI